MTDVLFAKSESTVPASVPSVVQSSIPLVPSSARKKRNPPTSTRPDGDELPTPGWMSFTRTAPASLPSLFQSSVALVTSFAAKNSVRFRGVRGVEGEPKVSPMRKVPAAVPSLRQSLHPFSLRSSWAPRFGASMIPGPPPVTTV